MRLWKKFNRTGETVFVHTPRTVDASNEIAFDYDKNVSGFVQYLFNQCGHGCSFSREESGEVGLLQALLPAQTAAFSRNPILGSMDGQVKYANTVNLVRTEVVTQAVYFEPKGVDTIITQVLKAWTNLTGGNQTLPVNGPQ